MIWKYCYNNSKRLPFPEDAITFNIKPWLLELRMMSFGLLLELNTTWSLLVYVNSSVVFIPSPQILFAVCLVVSANIYQLSWIRCFIIHLYLEKNIYRISFLHKWGWIFFFFFGVSKWLNVWSWLGLLEDKIWNSLNYDCGMELKKLRTTS